MIIDWIRAFPPTVQRSMMIFEVQGKTGAFSRHLASLFPNIRFEVQDSSLDLITEGKAGLSSELSMQVSFRQRDLQSPRTSEEIRAAGLFEQVIFLLRGILWNLNDDQVIALLQSFCPVMKCPGGPRLLVSDLVSPAWSTFEPHVERAYRRRDVTLMTMHNVKQRTSAEWNHLIAAADPLFKVCLRSRIVTRYIDSVLVSLRGKTYLTQLSWSLGDLGGCLNRPMVMFHCVSIFRGPRAKYYSVQILLVSFRTRCMTVRSRLGPLYVTRPN